MKAISLFSGAGGMDVGFRNAGFEIVWANDINKDACKTYELNHGPKIRCENLDFLYKEITDISSKQEIDCVFGGPPCQGFSVAGKMDQNDPRSKLVQSFLDVVGITKPKAFVMENVKALATLEKFKPIRDALIKKAIDLGYDIELVVLNAKDYGVPQSRERMFFVGIKGRKNRFKEILKKFKKEPLPLKEVLLSVGKIGSVANNRTCKAKITLASKPILRKSPHAGMMFNGQGRPLNLKSYSSTLPASMGGNRTPIIDDNALYNGEPEWITEYHSHLIAGGTPLSFESAPTFLRRLSIDEAIAIQTFPKDYLFHGPQSSVFSQIGNAVPCLLAESVATSIYNNLEIANSSVHTNDYFELEVA